MQIDVKEKIVDFYYKIIWVFSEGLGIYSKNKKDRKKSLEEFEDFKKEINNPKINEESLFKRVKLIQEVSQSAIYGTLILYALVMLFNILFISAFLKLDISVFYIITIVSSSIHILPMILLFRSHFAYLDYKRFKKNGSKDFNLSKKISMKYYDIAFTPSIAILALYFEYITR